MQRVRSRCRGDICASFQLWVDVWVVPSLGVVMSEAEHSCVASGAAIYTFLSGKYIWRDIYISRSGIAGLKAKRMFSSSRYFEEFYKSVVHTA